jgi:hypothetical protein
MNGYHKALRHRCRIKRTQLCSRLQFVRTLNVNKFFSSGRKIPSSVTSRKKYGREAHLADLYTAVFTTSLVTPSNSEDSKPNLILMLSIIAFLSEPNHEDRLILFPTTKVRHLYLSLNKFAVNDLLLAPQIVVCTC